MNFGQILLTIGVAVIGTAGATFGFIQFLIKRKDDKEEKDVQKIVNASVDAAKKEMQEKLDAVSIARSLEGKDRFDTHAAAIMEINEQIKSNSEQIGELTELTKEQVKTMSGFAESLTALNKMAKMSAESQRNNTYDRILMVANKVLKNQKITITEKTNLKQLYSSWEDFHAEGEKLDPKIVTIYEECMKLTPVPDTE